MNSVAEGGNEGDSMGHANEDCMTVKAFELPLTWWSGQEGTRSNFHDDQCGSSLAFENLPS